MIEAGSVISISGFRVKQDSANSRYLVVLVCFAQPVSKRT